MRPITKIIIQLIDDMKDASSLVSKHLEEGMPMVGFHYIIGKDASVEEGRPISAIGNHYVGDNATSIGIAIIGKELSAKQETALNSLIEDIWLKAPEAKNVLIVENGELKKYE